MAIHSAKENRPSHLAKGPMVTIPLLLLRDLIEEHRLCSNANRRTKSGWPAYWKARKALEQAILVNFPNIKIQKMEDGQWVALREPIRASKTSIKVARSTRSGS